MLCYFKICFLLSSKIHRRPALLPPTHSKWPRPLPIFWQPLLQELIILQWVLINGCAKTWYHIHQALLHWPEKESSYLSPNYSSQAAWAGQSATGWSKQLGKKNWGWDTCSLSRISAESWRTNSWNEKWINFYIFNHFFSSSIFSRVLSIRPPIPLHFFNLCSMVKLQGCPNRQPISLHQHSLR